ncbi:peptide chain release factor 2 [Patescibacteria group bacterium]|nr:peptide chain release factor 2 [Patescibacteria group bacterium]
MTDISGLRQRFQALRSVLSIDEKRTELGELELASHAPDLWNDQEQAVRLLSRLNTVQALLEEWEELDGYLSMEGELSESDLQALDGQITNLEKQALLSGEHDESNAILTIHAGTGGVDAQDWAAMLQRMYIRFVEQGKTEQENERTMSIDRSRWKVELLDLISGEEAGIKKAVLEVQGSYAYGLLKAEAGVHRLVRLSPFNAKNLRQTSFALVEVIPEVEQGKAVQIDEKDLRIDVFRSGGHGGQGVNTTDSAVRLTHIPSGIVVAVQNERSQHQNKATAMKILQARLTRLQEEREQQETAILKGEFKEGSWGNQIRSYVMQPYQMVKDHRTEFETAQVQQVLDGAIGPFITAYLTNINK